MSTKKDKYTTIQSNEINLDESMLEEQHNFVKASTKKSKDSLYHGIEYDSSITNDLQYIEKIFKDDQYE